MDAMGCWCGIVYCLLLCWEGFARASTGELDFARFACVGLCRCVSYEGAAWVYLRAALVLGSLVREVDVHLSYGWCYGWFEGFAGLEVC